VHSRARKTDAGGATLRQRLKHGGTTAEDTGMVLTTSYAQYSEYWGRNPGTGAATGHEWCCSDTWFPS
jgi:hypothetical protein